MRSLNRSLKQYYRQVRRWLPCSRKLKKQILAQIESSISAYLQEHPSADIAEIKARFGEPQQIAAAHVDELDTADLLRDLRVKRKVVGIVATCAAAVILMWGAVVGVALIDDFKAENGIFDVLVEDITPEE